MGVLTLVPLVLQLIQAGVTEIPELISAAQTEVSLFNSQTPPTAEQQAEIDAALEKAHAALQAVA